MRKTTTNLTLTFHEKIEALYTRDGISSTICTPNTPSAKIDRLSGTELTSGERDESVRIRTRSRGVAVRGSWRSGGRQFGKKRMIMMGVVREAAAATETETTLTFWRRGRAKMISGRESR